MELDRWVWVLALVGAWASAGREVFLHLEVEDSTVSAEAVSPGVVAVAAPGEEVVAGACPARDGEAGDTVIPDICRHTAIPDMHQPPATRNTPQLIPRTTVTRP